MLRRRQRAQRCRCCRHRRRRRGSRKIVAAAASVAFVERAAGHDGRGRGDGAKQAAQARARDLEGRGSDGDGRRLLLLLSAVSARLGRRRVSIHGGARDSQPGEQRPVVEVERGRDAQVDRGAARRHGGCAGRARRRAANSSGSRELLLKQERRFRCHCRRCRFRGGEGARSGTSRGCERRTKKRRRRSFFQGQCPRTRAASQSLLLLQERHRRKRGQKVPCRAQRRRPAPPSLRPAAAPPSRCRGRRSRPRRPSGVAKCRRRPWGRVPAAREGRASPRRGSRCQCSCFRCGSRCRLGSPRAKSPPPPRPTTKPCAGGGGGRAATRGRRHSR